MDMVQQNCGEKNFLLHESFNFVLPPWPTFQNPQTNWHESVQTSARPSTPNDEQHVFYELSTNCKWIVQRKKNNSANKYEHNKSFDHHWPSLGVPTMSVSATRVKSPMLVVEIPVMWLNSCTTCTPQNPNDERQQRHSKLSTSFSSGDFKHPSPAPSLWRGGWRRRRRWRPRPAACNLLSPAQTSLWVKVSCSLYIVSSITRTFILKALSLIFTNVSFPTLFSVRIARMRTQSMFWTVFKRVLEAALYGTSAPR